MKIDTTEYDRKNPNSKVGYGMYGFTAVWSDGATTSHFGHGRSPGDTWRVIGSELDQSRRILVQVELVWFIKH